MTDKVENTCKKMNLNPTFHPLLKLIQLGTDLSTYILNYKISISEPR